MPSLFLKIKNCKILAIIIYLAAVVLFSGAAKAADIVAVSHLGYHPNSAKQVVVYTDAESGNFDIKNSANNQVIAAFDLKKSKDALGNNVECQGNMPCLVGDFTSFNQEGTFYAQSSGLKSRNFDISSNIYASSVPILLEFFNAQKQQNSDYHADMHSNYMPPLTIISDGSFIMEAHQAASALIRLGSAYRRNPSLFQSTSIKEHISNYAKYLQGLQGISVSENDSQDAIRLGYGMKIDKVFVPGPTSLTQLDVYIPGNPPSKLTGSPFPVVSLCGADNGTPEWNKCIQDAATFYKCQIDEPCLDMSYNNLKGTLSNGNGYAVSKGWNYEFGCFFDINLNENLFNGKPNPCLVFFPQIIDPETSKDYTSQSLLAFLEAYPAVRGLSPSEGQALLERAINTYNYLKTNPPGVDNEYIGAALFLLYDYAPGNNNYLAEAYSLRSSVSTQLISDHTRANEFYWEEYVRHKDDIIAANLEYKLNGQDPEEFFRGKMFFDYGAGPNSMSKTGERIFQFDHNVQFQNSRYILTEGLLAAKTIELRPQSEYFIHEIADMQLAWLTGMNNVQQGVSLESPTKSMSFIFGIGDFPAQFHSRYLIDTGNKAASQGSVIGARGTDYQFLDSSDNQYYYLDGKSTILGYVLGALGNAWNNEQKINPYVIGKSFKNGKNYISGWINGPFDTVAETDIIFNYNDDLNTYQFTETTDEIVATAVEFYAYLDGIKNNKPRHDGKVLNLPNLPLPKLNITLGNQTDNTTNNNNNTNSSNITSNSSLSISTNPGLVDIHLNSTFYGTTGSDGNFHIPSLIPDDYLLIANKDNYKLYSTVISLSPGQNLSLPINLTQNGPSNSSSAKITKNSTSLAKFTISNGAGYYMREDSTASFIVFSNDTNSIKWYIDNNLIFSTLGKNSTFNWTPGVLWIPKAPDFSNIGMSTVKAVSSTEEVTWKVDIENVINPFFSSLDGGSDVTGSADTQIHVFTNDKLVDFTHVNATIQSKEGQNIVNTVYELGKGFVGNNETDWRKDILNMAYGNNYLVKITGFNNATKSTAVYELATERSHYRELPQNFNAENEKEEENEEEESENEVNFARAELVYATFGKDVVGLNDTQTITLDAKNFNGGVHKVEATLISPSGLARTITLQLVKGTREYGTWSAKFDGFVTGLYVLQSVSLNNNPISVEDGSFYVVDDGVGANEHLMLVYSVLSHSSVKNGSNVTFKIDARDVDGIISVSAGIKGSKSGEFTIPLRLIGGNKNYGTWQGTFKVTEPDSTYYVVNLVLSNKNQSKTYEINNRAVYVLPSSSKNNFAHDDSSPKNPLAILAKKPLVPTLVGFGLMFFVIGTLMMGQKVRKRPKPHVTFGKI